MPYRIALLDDEQTQLDRTRAMVEKLFAREGFDAAVTPFHGVFEMPSMAFDAYLLDISMPGMDGLQLASRIRAAGSAAPIIFITAIEERVFEAIRAQPLRFVRKGRLGEELPEAIRALCLQLRREEQTALAFQCEGALVRVPVSRILYVESSDKLQRVVLTERGYDVRANMAFFESRLEPLGFLRIHRCYLVNLQAVYSIDKNDAVLSNGERLPVSRFRLAALREEFKRMMFHDESLQPAPRPGSADPDVAAGRADLGV